MKAFGRLITGMSHRWCHQDEKFWLVNWMMTSSAQLKMSGQLVFLQFLDSVNRDQIHLVMKVLEHSDWLKMSNHPNCHRLVVTNRCYTLYRNRLVTDRYRSMGSKLDQSCTNSKKIGYTSSKNFTSHRQTDILANTYRWRIIIWPNRFNAGIGFHRSDRIKWSKSRIFC